MSEVAVVGAGVIGSSIGYHLAMQGALVTILDPGAPQRPAASWASAGGVRRQNRDIREWALAREASARWARLSEELEGETGFRPGGHLHLALGVEGLERIGARSAEESRFGLDVRMLGEVEVRELVPGLHAGVMGGSYTRGDGHADPRATTVAWQKAALRRGVSFQRTAVVGLLRSGDRVDGVVTASGHVRAGAVVLAAGAWTGGILGSAAGTPLALTVQGLQMLLSDPAAPVLQPTLSAEGRRLSLKQLSNGGYLVGGGWPATVDQATEACEVTEDSVQANWREAIGVLPAVAERRMVDAWCGIEAFTPDGVPLIGPVPGLDGAWVAAGFCGHGFQLSPAVGRAVAAALLGGDAPELAPFSPSRF
jgi:sarcosine oxidase, subunit beta